MTLSRVALVGAVALGMVAGAPLAAAQPTSDSPATTTSVVPPAPVQTPAASDATTTAPATTTAATTTAAPASTPAAATAGTAQSSTTAVATTSSVVAAADAEVAPSTATGAQPGPTSAAPASGTPATDVAEPVTCTPWTVDTVATGFGVLENLAFDGDGRLLLSESPIPGDGAIRTLTPAGEKGTLVEDVPSPGGLLVSGDRILFTTGNNVMAGLWDSTNGTVESVNRDGGDRTTVADGLTMPNGLTALPDGDLLVTQAFGRQPGLTRITASGESEKVRTDLGSVNGLFATDSAVYASDTVEPQTRIHILDAGDLAAAESTVTVPGNGVTNAADDLEVGADGLIYVALNGGGKVVRVDPVSGDSCDIATDLTLVSSVSFGAGPGWDASSLYTTGFDGTVHRLTPPVHRDGE